ncbi:multi-domain protein [Rhodopirellula sallentina SM41]|uniref:Multi-domain protein n=1 Tax=Rhodopirellula sallentina SM41 TaxID=1263870 RepID=M5U730_9BACT|nr:multi-domain protein [Rhodopirellula sallentina SM41]
MPQPFLRSALIVLAVLVSSGPIIAEDGFHVLQCHTDYQTPLIPGTEFTVHQTDRPQPPRVIPGEMDSQAPPSDAIVLFDGRSLEHFRPTKWTVREGWIVAGAGPLVTEDAFGDCQLHVEWRTPDPPTNNPMNAGNSGIFFMQKYELQVFDSYTCKIYADGSAGAIYGQTPPLVNACRPPGQWQTFDVFFGSPKFDGDRLVAPALITVLHNGVFVQVDTEILGPTRHQKSLPYEPHADRMPILFQGHGSPVAFRNIWVRDLANSNNSTKEQLP